MNVRDIRIEDFDYPLPDEQIARHPLPQRDGCRLLMAVPGAGISHHTFSELPALMAPGALLVCNNTRVINARMRFRKDTGAEIEVFLLEPVSPEDYNLMFQSRGKCVWRCLVGNLKRWKQGELHKPLAEGVLTAVRGAALPGNSHSIEFSWDNPALTFADVVEQAGFIPIPPYLNRQSEACDATDYQTVYAHVKGSVAAPTAGLHFTPEVFRAMAENGVEKEELTLHVGAGTFQPVKSDTIGGHPMHTETFSVTRHLVEKLVEAKEMGRPVYAVGTTSVRTLESLPYLGHSLPETYVDQWDPYDARKGDFDTLEALRRLLGYMETNELEFVTASTSIMIAPGFRWRIVDGMVTNFHQPQSTLLLLVSSFLERGGVDWRNVYREALEKGYRFLSYGDACLFK